jgi:hypothetical protein
MPFNGLGTFSLVYDWIQDRNNNIKILASRMMGQEDDIASGLSQCITVDGQSTITNAIPFSNQQITLLAAATTVGGAANLGQVQAGSANYASASAASVGVYVAGFSPPLTALSDGMMFNVYFPSTNATSGTATFNPDALGAVNIVDLQGTLVRPSAVKAGLGILTYRQSKFYYMVPTVGPFGFTDGGFLATGATADVNTVYMVDCTGTARLVTLSAAVSTGDSIPLTIFGTNNCAMYGNGNPLRGLSSTIDTGGQEGFASLRYTGPSRGWVW